jgi:predicted nuclease with TOPRIM domain
MEPLGEIAALLGTGIASGAVVSAVAGWLFKRWMDAREKREEVLAGKIDELSAHMSRMQVEGKECAIGFHAVFRTKSEAEREYGRLREEQDNQWSKINDHDRRLSRLEAVCERERDRSK